MATSFILPDTGNFTNPMTDFHVIRGSCIYDPKLEDLTGVGDTDINMQPGGFIIVTGQLQGVATRESTPSTWGPNFATIKGRLKFFTDAGEHIDSGANGCHLTKKNHAFVYASSGNKKVYMVVNYIMSNPTITNIGS